MRLLLVVSLLAVAFSTPGCGRKSESKPAALFPQSNEVAGWTKSGETRTFEASNLWEYIDGDAEKYIQAGVERTLTADYRYQDKIEAVADIHIMKAPEGTRKVFDSESSAESRPVELGDAARLTRGSLTFRKGRYLVRLTAFQDAPEVGKALLELGRAIERRLG